MVEFTISVLVVIVEPVSIEYVPDPIIIVDIAAVDAIIEEPSMDEYTAVFVSSVEIEIVELMIHVLLVFVDPFIVEYVIDPVEILDVMAEDAAIVELTIIVFVVIVEPCNVEYIPEPSVKVDAPNVDV